MCAKGINWNTTYKLHIGANQDADTTVVGWENDTTLGEKTETIVGVWGVGVVGPKVEAVIGAQIGIIAGFKGEWTTGLKYDRVPYGEVHIVGDHTGVHASHSTTIGTSFFVNAGDYAQIVAPTLILTAIAPVAAVDAVNEIPQKVSPLGNIIQAYVPGKPPVLATTNATTLSLLATQALLTGGGNSTTNLHPANLALTQAGATLTGITPSNLVSISESALLINHATEANFGISNGNSVTAASNGVFVNSASGVFLNGGTAGVVANGTVKLGEPSAYIPSYQSLLTAAETAATDAATEAENAATTAVKAGAMPAPGTATGH